MPLFAISGFIVIIGWCIDTAISRLSVGEVRNPVHHKKHKDLPHPDRATTSLAGDHLKSDRNSTHETP